ncbi:MAG: DNA repair protein RecN, partial [Lachnospiraceae bacterium]
LETKYHKLIHGKRIIEACSAINGYMNTDEEAGNESAGELIGRASKELNTVLAYDDALIPMEESLHTIEDLVHDFNRSVTDYMSELQYDAQIWTETEERLDLLNRLKSKYGNQIEEILLYKKKQEDAITRLQDYEAYRDGLRQRLEESEQKLRSLCEKASVIRERYAKKLSQEMTQALLDLNFLTVQFEIQVRRKEQYSILGYDEAEFMISTNPGEPLKPLSEVASGGELSRIMLALKTVLADKDSIPSLIFDEIDAGISGKTAWKVSEKLAKLSCNHQVICITHLPQIAAMADSHYVITKNSLEGITQTCIKEIKDEDVIEELARLLGGEQITQAALGNAAELKKMATDNKNKFK